MINNNWNWFVKFELKNNVGKVWKTHKTLMDFYAILYERLLRGAKLIPKVRPSIRHVHFESWVESVVCDTDHVTWLVRRVLGHMTSSHHHQMKSIYRRAKSSTFLPFKKFAPHTPPTWLYQGSGEGVIVSQKESTCRAAPRWTKAIQRCHKDDDGQSNTIMKRW